MTDVCSAIAERIDAIAAWRREREFQDMMGLGPDAAARSRRSADGLEALAAFVRALPDDDARLERLRKAAFRGEVFDPGATLLTELGRFRFHDPDAPVEPFLDRMVEWAEQDEREMGEWGGPQVSGDNPWRWTANWTVQVDVTSDDEDDEYFRRKASEARDRWDA
ncbi:MAG: hypothetical protein QM589_05095 [Thermomicrobiales bacterium]